MCVFEYTPRARAYSRKHTMGLGGIPPCFYKLPLSSFCPCSLLVDRGAEGPPAWAHGPGELAFSGLLFPAPSVHGQRTGAGTAAFLGTIVCLCSSGSSSKSLKQHILCRTEQPFCPGAAGLEVGVVGGPLTRRVGILRPAAGAVSPSRQVVGEGTRNQSQQQVGSSSRDSTFPGSGRGVIASSLSLPSGHPGRPQGVLPGQEKTLSPKLPCRSREGAQTSRELVRTWLVIESVGQSRLDSE